MNLVRDYALKVLSKKEYSVQEFAQKLAVKFPEKTQERSEILKEFAEKKWLSDERFTQAFIHDQVLSTKSGPQKIIGKLRQKGIPKFTAENMLAEILPESKQLILIERMAEKKKSEYLARNEKFDTSAQQKVMRYFIQKGYHFDMVKKVILNISES